MQSLPSRSLSDGSAQQASLTYAAFGVRVGVHGTPALLERVPARLIAGATPAEAGPADMVFTVSEKRSGTGQLLYDVAGSAGTFASGATVENALLALERSAEEFVAERAREFVFVHAGAVAWGGQAILIPGRSFSGKSTLVMALVRAGATYLSDEYAVLDRNGLVHPFARQPRLRAAADSRSKESGRPMTFVNTQSAGGPLPVGLVIKTAYKPDAVWEPFPMTPGETLLTLIENTVAVRSQSEFTIAVIKNLLVYARGMRTARSEASAAAAEILQGLERRPK